jgi:hypothetical protein
VILVAVLLLAIAVCLAVAAVRGWTAVGRVDCDNEMNECLRRRQKLAIDGIALLCTGIAAWAIWSAVSVLRRGRVTARVVVIAGAGAAVALAFFAVDPVARIDDSVSGWLAAVPVQRPPI